MRWQGRRKSDNVEDQRGRGGGHGLKIGGGVGGLGIVIAILYMLLGGNPSEITESLLVDQPRAASAVGDDRIMKHTQGYVVPDAFTHGTSEQRVRWFKKGLESGDIDQGDTFGAAIL